MLFKATKIEWKLDSRWSILFYLFYKFYYRLNIDNKK